MNTLNKVTTWNPLREMDEAQNRLNRFFLGGFPSRTGSDEIHSLAVADWSPEVDISEDDQGYLLKADLPEMKKDDVRVTVEDGILSVSGERKCQKEDEKKKFHRIERSFGTFRRNFTLPEDADSTKVTAEVRDGVLSDRQSFYLANESERPIGDVIEEFLLQYYADALSIPAQIVVQRELGERPELGEALSLSRRGAVELRMAERGDKRRILDLAERNAKLALDQERLKVERRRQQRAEALEGLQEALGIDALPLRIECFDISHLMGTQQVASMVVFEGGAPKKSDYRRFRVRENVEGRSDDVAAMAEVLGRRFGQWERQADLSPHDAQHDPSFAALPNVIVIDGGPGQLGAVLEPLREFRERGVTVISLAKRIEEVFLPGVARPLRLAHDTPELQLLQRVRDEAHRFAITHHRTRRDRAMTASVLDELPGVGPARKRAILKHFGSPDAFLAATREELEAVPGLPGKVARELYASLHKTGV